MIQLQNLSQNSTESLSITAVIDSALCVGAGGTSGTLADKPIVRTATGKLLIPASQFKGRLRHECEKIARGLHRKVCESPNPQTMCPQRAKFPENEEREFHRPDYQIAGDERYHCLICQIFGNPALPSRLLFDDLICNEKAENLPEVLRPGVTINRRRRTSEDQKLFLLETSPANIQLEFSGHIHFLPRYPAYAKPLLFAALHHIHALGGSKSGGLGWLHWKFPDLKIDDNAWNALKT
ncbi:CRISPR-associated protein Csm3 [Planktothrix sp. FACHB-1355]|uniref:CRISPR-associated protein Csm3 n=1 Tax=Aerosakkonema funiforme FACHB-1375 TaxID=2949571 RepID=A0A926VEE6_9CYAN|nr:MULTISPECIES: RAMP superfamily CRISPR-associated protein [Oscillatoriales]MBD2182386.1 CRISPR-associated protein Csm3 [Aerosakkonema funiforme FACHB-1375]MBD3559250.1 CRISPR-associated protein Csm3 [Planktothrix sp. FACHB-1355]